MKIHGPGYSGLAADGPARDARSAGADFAAALEQAASGDSPKGQTAQADFMNMTRPDLFDCMNTRIKSGQLSLDDSVAILRLANTESIGEPAPASARSERLNFYQLSRDGIANARLRNDPVAEGLCRTALRIMQKFQTQTDQRV